MSTPDPKSLRSGERFVAPTVEQITLIDPMHTARYEAVSRWLGPQSMVHDYGCGCGYGSYILHRAGHLVDAVDYSAEAIDYAVEHYRGPQYTCGSDPEIIPDGCDGVVMFEVLEHLDDPANAVVSAHRSLRAGGHLFVSVPTHRVPEIIGGNQHHERHYDAASLLELLMPRFQIHHLEHQSRHLGTGRWHRDCGLFVVARKS